MGELFPGGPLELPHSFEHAGVRVSLPYVDNMRLLEMLAYGRWSHFYPGLMPESQGWQLEMRLWDQTDRNFDIRHLFWVASTLLGRVAGMYRYRPADPADPITTPEYEDSGYRAARQLSAWVLFNWPEFIAWCTGRALNPVEMPFWLLMGSAYQWQLDLRGHDHDAIVALNDHLWPTPSERVPLALDSAAAPPPGYVEVDGELVPQAWLDEERQLLETELRGMGLIPPPEGTSAS